MTLLQSGIAKSGAAYAIDQSLRFEPTDSPSLTRTPGSDGNMKTWTFSFWYKCVDPDFPGDRDILSSTTGAAPANEHWFRFGPRGTNNQFVISWGYNYNIYATDAYFRDVGAWYHVVVRVDSTQASWDDRLRVYVNGELSPISNVYTQPDGVPPQDAITAINSTDKQELMIYSYGTDVFVPGYLAEVYMIDGLSLAPSSFGETDEDTNQWKPINASGLTFGTNGFYLKFQDSSDFGDDSSGNGNDYTATNLVATDQMKDSPTNNFATLNALVKPYGTSTFAEGNLKVTTSAAWNAILGTPSMSSGKWYWEAVSESTNFKVGVMPDDVPQSIVNVHTAYGILYLSDGTKQIDGTATSYGATFVGGDILGYAVDMDASTITFYKNGASQGAISFSGTVANAASAIPGGVSLSDYSYWNFGSDSSFAGTETAQGNTDGNGIGDFYYEPPSDYLALCTSNLSDPSIALPGEHFNTVLYTGDDGTDRTVTSVGFQPDFLWIKSRTTTASHVLMDVARGVGSSVHSDSTSAANVYPSAWNTSWGWLDSFDSDGFTVSTGTQASGNFNSNTVNYVGWNWLAGGAPTATNVATTGVMTSGSVFQNGVSNTSFTPADGTYPDKISANTTNGFSIVNGPTPGTATQFAHGLSQAPELIIAKSMDKVDYWPVGATVLASGWTKFLYFNTADWAPTGSTLWNDTAPTADVFTIGTQNAFNNAGENTIFYCFHSVENFSKIGAYDSNDDSDGVFIYTGFRPAYVLIKGIDIARGWYIFDDKRDTYNLAENYLIADTTGAEVELTRGIDILSNGFKLRSSDSFWNNINTEYLYWAIAESPFKYANAR